MPGPPLPGPACFPPPLCTASTHLLLPLPLPPRSGDLDLAQCWSTVLCRLEGWGWRTGTLHSALGSLGEKGSHQVIWGDPRSQPHQFQPSNLPEASAWSPGRKWWLGEGRLQVLRLFLLKWHPWCNPQRLTVVFKLKCEFLNCSMACYTGRYQTPPTEISRSGGEPKCQE